MPRWHFFSGPPPTKGMEGSTLGSIPVRYRKKWRFSLSLSFCLSLCRASLTQRYGVILGHLFPNPLNLSGLRRLSDEHQCKWPPNRERLEERTTCPSAFVEAVRTLCDDQRKGMVREVPPPPRFNPRVGTYHSPLMTQATQRRGMANFFGGNAPSYVFPSFFLDEECL